MDWFAISSLKMDLSWAGQMEATPNPKNGFVFIRTTQDTPKAKNGFVSSK